jgi:DNA polymerase-3 subunit beta
MFKLPSANPDEFPTVAVFDENTYHEIPARLFKEMLRRTVFAADNESSRYALGGVLLEMQDEDVIAVGTDGRRLAKMEGKGVSVGGHRTTGMTTIVPTRAVTLLERAISDKDEKVEVAARSNDLLVRTPRFTIYTRLVEGRYPNWRMVFPKREDAVNIDGLVGQFFAATRQASIVADKDSRGIEFKFGEGSLVLSGRAANIGQSTVDFPISYDGPPITVMMDHRFVGDFFRVLEQDKQFRIEIGAGNEAAVFSTDDGYAYVVMPMAR